MLMGVEIAPQNNLQTGFCIVTIVAGAMVQAILFGEMTVLMSSLGRKQDKFAKIKDKISNTMKSLGLPEDLQLKILDYLILSQGNLDEKNQYQEF
jgi:hypothetical protein